MGKGKIERETEREREKKKKGIFGWEEHKRKERAKCAAFERDN